MNAGRFAVASLLFLGAAGAMFLVTRPTSSRPPDTTRVDRPALALDIQHPFAGAVMPANMPGPVLLWRTNQPGISHWQAEFKAGKQTWSFEDIQLMWRPPEPEWRRMKDAAQGAPIQLTISGTDAANRRQAIAAGSVAFSISPDAVKTPLFYRDVNLPFLEAVKDPSKIRWRFGPLDTGTLPPIVLEKMPVCGNCHSFSRDGGLLAMDIDYANNKGSYVITRTGKDMRLATSDIITWDDYRRDEGQESLGLLSQISPNGRYVLSTVKDLSVFMPKPDLAFSQLFFPFMGIIGVYDRDTKRFFSLPGADDPAFVQSNPTWSPDGKWIVFARNRAVILKTVVKKGRLMLNREDDEELFKQTREFRYDLCRVPFNAGKGGQAEPLRGASKNGRSNYFPKYSPDGRWIIYCQAANYMLLQPDSEMFIIPAEGGEARRLACNLNRMNSWHTWSPDSRWLVFTSKAHSDYTQLYVTRINEQGEASPAVWLAHMVEPGRVANIPEFVDLPPDGIGKIREQFLDDLSYVRAGNEFLRSGEVENAVGKYKTALSFNPDNAVAHQKLGLLLDKTDKASALEHLQAAVRLNPRDPLAQFALGCSLANRGDLTNGVAHLESAVEWLSEADERNTEAVDPKHRFPEVLHYKLSLAYDRLGKWQLSENHCREAVRLAPDYMEAHYNLGTLLLRSNRPQEAEEHFTAALRTALEFGAAYNGLGIARQRQNRPAEAMVSFAKAIQCDPKDWQAHLNLAMASLTTGDTNKAVSELRETLRISPDCQPAQQALAKMQNLPESR